MNNKFYCRDCKGVRNHEKLFEKIITPDYDVDAFMFSDKYIVVQCSGCSCLTFVRLYGDESMFSYNQDTESQEYYYDTTIYPPAKPHCSSVEYLHFVPQIVQKIYKETITALNSELYILAGAGFRGVIEAICKDLNITGRNLESKIKKLNTLGHITQKQSEIVHSIRFLGNDSLHEIQVPKLDKLILLLYIVNHLIVNLYIQDKLIENKLDTLISQYDKFISLLKHKLSQEQINTKKSLTDYLGKSKRRVDSNQFAAFEQNLIQEINNGQFQYLSIVSPDLYELVDVPNQFLFEFF